MKKSVLTIILLLSFVFSACTGPVSKGPLNLMENILISPLSIVSALGMVANGAKGNTLSEMEKVLNSDIEGLNDYLKAYAEYLPSSEQYKVSLVNSIWFSDKEALTV